MGPVDVEGTEFAVGDVFYSAQSRRRSTYLNKYKVLDIETKVGRAGKPVFVLKAEPYRRYDWESPSPVRITKFDSCYILPSAV
jgi:hypothetical protein